jgi:hypothetical protein
MLRTVASGQHVGLVAHVPVSASVVHDHGLPTIAVRPRSLRRNPLADHGDHC